MARQVRVECSLVIDPAEDTLAALPSGILES